MELLTNLETYAKSAKRIAQSILPPQQIDSLANDQDDYAHQLLIASWEAQIAFRKQHGFCTPAERRWVHTCLWNKVRNVRRDSAWLACRKLPLEHVRLDSIQHDMVAQLEAREYLKQLQAVLSDDEWSTLCRVAEAGGISKAFEERDGNLARFQKRIRNLRKRAKQLVENNCSRNGHLAG
jgi:hypothetical protein